MEEATGIAATAAPDVLGFLLQAGIQIWDLMDIIERGVASSLVVDAGVVPP
jgi:hypothetical protein